jgi:RNA 3'-terminal phosphate cyclase (ATP)
MKAIHVDGSRGEGGGQMVRTSLSLAALLGCEVTVDNIRAGRPSPGLAAQHVTCVRAAAAICAARVEGDHVGSTTVHFRPGALAPGEYCFDVADVRPSAGSATLVLQTVLPPLLCAGGRSQVVVRGGTNVPWSPPFEYLAHVFAPALARMGANLELRRTRGGWYPAGGGELQATIGPAQGPLKPLALLERGRLVSLRAISTVSAGLADHIAGRQTTAGLQRLPSSVSRLAKRNVERPEGGPGTCFLLAAAFEGGNGGASALGERGKPAEQVGRETAEEFAAFWDSDAAVDGHLADQLLLYAALARGRSAYVAQQATEHLRTNAWVIRQFLDAEIALEGDAPCRVTVDGAGVASLRR